MIGRTNEGNISGEDKKKEKGNTHTHKWHKRQHIIMSVIDIAFTIAETGKEIARHPFPLVEQIGSRPTDTG